MARQLQPTSLILLVVLVVIALVKYSIDKGNSVQGTVRS